MNIQERACKNVSDIVTQATEHHDQSTMLVVYDEDSEVAQILTHGYKHSFPEAMYIEFKQDDKQSVLNAFEKASKGDLVVLIQSQDFRLDEFRIRLHLFNKGIKVIEHRHLDRNTKDMYETYIDSLAYDPEWYRGEGGKLKEILHNTDKLVVKCEGTELVVTGGLEKPKPNLGDYSEIKNIGGSFPIGEVFTEARDLHAVNGSLMIYAFADVNFNMAMHDPFRIDIRDGLVVGWGDNTPQAFMDVIEKIHTNEKAIIRELGFGMNRGITREQPLADITAFERILGLHVSLGEKHTVYKKEGITAKKTRFHVDLFVDAQEIISNDITIYKDGQYLLD